jgi:hypothetical protein
MNGSNFASGIPVSSVGHARTLADDGQRQQQGGPSPTTPVGDSSLHGDASFRSSTLLSPLPSTSGATSTPTSPSAGYRRSLVGGGTTKVLADLQAHTLQVKSVLENTKSQLRSSQRTIAQVRLGGSSHLIGLNLRLTLSFGVSLLLVDSSNRRFEGRT